MRTSFSQFLFLVIAWVSLGLSNAALSAEVKIDRFVESKNIASENCLRLKKISLEDDGYIHWYFKAEGWDTNSFVAENCEIHYRRRVRNGTSTGTSRR